MSDFFEKCNSFFSVNLVLHLKLALNIVLNSKNLIILKETFLNKLAELLIKIIMQEATVTILTF